MREWLSGRALPCQGKCREFESRLPLQLPHIVAKIINYAVIVSKVDYFFISKASVR